MPVRRKPRNISRDPEYYFNKISRLKKIMEANPPVTAPVLELPPAIKEKKRPGRKKKVLPPKNPITTSENGVIVSFS